MLRVVRALGLVTVQDLGRRGYMHAAVPCGGALVRGMLVDANRTVGNADDAAGLEVCGMVRVRAEGEVVVAVGRERRALGDGEEVEVASGASARVAYVAMRGGIDSEERRWAAGGRCCARGSGGWCERAT